MIAITKEERDKRERREKQILVTDAHTKQRTKTEGKKQILLNRRKNRNNPRWLTG